MQRHTTAAQAVEQLRQGQHDSPALEALLPTYELLLKLEDETEAPALTIQLDSSSAQALWEQGIPLLHSEESLILPQAMGAVWQQVCDLAARHLEQQTERLRGAREWPERQSEMWLELMEQYFRDGKAVAEDPQEQDVLSFLLVHTWRPFLRRWATELEDLLENPPWKQGRCPVCGGQPDFAYLGQEAGERYLVCARCDTSWRHQRLGCPFCGNQDSSTYGYYPDDEGLYRLYVCNDCRRYLKTVDLRQAGEGRLLAVERLATIRMDLAALQADYRGA